MNDNLTSKEKGYADDGCEDFDVVYYKQWDNPTSRKHLMDPGAKHISGISIVEADDRVKNAFGNANYILTPLMNVRGVKDISKEKEDIIAFHAFSYIEKVWWTHKYSIYKIDS
jgi:hypothetical protein